MATFETGFEYLLLSGAVKIYWGDGTSETIASPCNGPAMHEYTGEIGAEFFVAFDDPTKVLEMRMESNLFEIVAGTLAKFVNMQDLDLENTTGSLVQSDLDAMPNLRRIIMIDFGTPDIDTWEDLPIDAMDLQNEDADGYAIETIPSLYKLTALRLGMNLSQEDMDDLLLAIYANRALYTGPDYYDPDPRVDGPLYLDFSVGNGSVIPSGIYRDSEGPSTGMECIYALFNDRSQEGFLKWRFDWVGGTINLGQLFASLIGNNQIVSIDYELVGVFNEGSHIVLVDWGDGSTPTELAKGASGTLSHEYVEGGPYQITIDYPEAFYSLSFSDQSIGFNEGGLDQFTNLTSLVAESPLGTAIYDNTLVHLNAITSLTLQNCTVDFSEGDLASTDLSVLSLTYMTGDFYSAEVASLLNIEEISIANDLPSSEITALLAAIYANRANYVYDGEVITLDLTGNASPSDDGVYEDVENPSKFHEYRYKLENDPDEEGFVKWDISYQEPLG